MIHSTELIQPVAAVLGFTLWWWTPFFLLAGRVRARALLLFCLSFD
ncbi:MAG TPA: hypothetical protein VMS92_22470 [Mycobacterium sp.]|nr:hypothetical protein [Mycobacterium sp.]